MNYDEISMLIYDFVFKKRFTSIDKATLDQIEDENLIEEIYDYVSQQIVGEDWDNEYQKVKDSPVGFQYIYAIWNLECQVNNGGFTQFFFNYSEQFVDEAYEGLIAIGANKTAEILRNAVATFMEEIDMLLEIRKERTIEALSECYKKSKLQKWDSEFFKRQDNLKELQIKYIRKNYKDFMLKKSVD